MLGQAIPYSEVLDARSTAVLGLIAVLLVGFLGWLVARSLTKKPDDETLSDRVVRAIALIEHEGIDLPKNWRDFVDARIKHHDKNHRAKLASYAYLLDRGQSATVVKLLRDEAEGEEE